MEGKGHRHEEDEVGRHKRHGNQRCSAGQQQREPYALADWALQQLEPGAAAF